MTQKIHVFIIDDSEVDSFLTKQELNDVVRIQHITHFKSPQAALNFILDHAHHDKLPDLILLDITMPVIDGFEFLEELEESERFPDDYPFKIILLTNSKTIRDREKFEREPNAIKFVEKPVRKVDLECLIEEIFN